MICALGLAWWQAPRLAGWLVYSGPRSSEAPQQGPDTQALQVAIESTLASVGIDETMLLERSTTARSDQVGSWQVQKSSWRLPPSRDPRETAERLRSLLASSDTAVEVYLLAGEAQQVSMRAYAGGRLAAIVLFEPTLGEWPDLAPGSAPLLALALTGVDSDPHAAHGLMEQELPLALVLAPSSPFTLRFSRDALLSHKEVLALAEPDLPWNDSLDGVPHASGLLVVAAPTGDPHQAARALSAAQAYVLDTLPGGLSARWLRALHDAGVPCVRGFAVLSAHDEGDEDGANARRRARHEAVTSGAAVLVVDLAGGAGQAEVQQLEAATARGYRAAFAAEAVERLERER